MRSLLVSVQLGFLFCILITPAQAQWLNYPTRGLPRTKSGKPNLTAPSPKTRDGKPDLSGIWFVVWPKEGLERGDREGVGPYLPDFMPKGAEIPLQPQAAALHKQRSENFGAGRPSSMCLPHSVPDAMLVSPFKIVQTRDVTLILFEEFNHYRQILTDGRKHPTDANPAWFGYSIGQWEGSTFVVDTRGFNDRSWIDDYGLPHTEALHTIERFERRDVGHMDLQITIDDPDAYTRDWSFTLKLELQPDSEIFEDICENERDTQHTVGR